MSKVAKLVIVDDNGKYLMLYRNNHPLFGNDPDLPGGTLEPGEEPLETMVREVYEEAGIVIDGAAAKKVYQGDDYSRHTTHYSLYVVKLADRPDVKLSWEHSSYLWLDRDDFMQQSKDAVDTYMQMVYKELTRFTL